MFKQNHVLRRFMAVLLIMLFFSSAAHATGANDRLQNDDYVPSNDNLFIVICDGEGNVVETHTVSRQIYVNGTQYTIPANGTLRTYQYYASDDFTAGFYFIHSDYSGYATTRNRNVKITVYNSSSVGGTRYYVDSQTFSTNEEDNTNDSGYTSGIQPGCSSVAISVTPVSDKPYYNAVYKNESSNSLVISLLVARD